MKEFKREIYALTKVKKSNNLIEFLGVSMEP
jgi:hypothetical protein